ncbi:MAG: hypothetical protein F2732_06770 [Actinobacteria bacterium]|nr:hypothetical protein [Actinomycetota bacterium]
MGQQAQTHHRAWLRSAPYGRSYRLCMVCQQCQGHSAAQSRRVGSQLARCCSSRRYCRHRTQSTSRR